MLFINITTYTSLPVSNQPINQLIQPVVAKTLELRYSTSINEEEEVVEIDEEVFRVFPNKKEAVDYYYFIKNSAPQKVIYYIVSTEQKDDETYEFQLMK